MSRYSFGNDPAKIEGYRAFWARAEARRPLGLAVVGGLVFSQSLTLYVTPVFYIYMEKFQNFIRRIFGIRAPLKSADP